eukprot:7086917-Pyramimonas_sp.AAC.1
MYNTRRFARDILHTFWNKCFVRDILKIKLSWRRTQPCAVVNTASMNIIFARAPYGATKRARGAPRCAAGHATRAKKIGLRAID